jgi:hypothetical protein
MEEREFKKIYQEQVELPCVFAKALLTRRHTCAKASPLNIAEREAISCTDPAAQQLCQAFLDLMYEKARFALQLSEKPLPHAKLLKLQGGAIQALSALQPDNSDHGVAALLQQNLNTYGDFDHLPFAVLVRYVGQYKVRGGGGGVSNTCNKS